MASTITSANEAALMEPRLRIYGGLSGAGWISESLCALAILPAVGMVSGAITIAQAVSMLAVAGALGVASLGLQERGGTGREQRD